jgi:hypothetical protein
MLKPKQWDKIMSEASLSAKCKRKMVAVTNGPEVGLRAALVEVRDDDSDLENE